jgi:hypothetical protein
MLCRTILEQRWDNRPLEINMRIASTIRSKTSRQPEETCLLEAAHIHMPNKPNKESKVFQATYNLCHIKNIVHGLSSRLQLEPQEDAVC